MNIMKTHYSLLSGVAALILISGTSGRADTIPLDSNLGNPFAVSRFHANLTGDVLEKEPVPTKSDIPEGGDGHLLSDFVFYNTLQTQDRVSLFGGAGGFPGGAIVTGASGGTGGSTQTTPTGGGEGDGRESIPQNPAPGAALLGMMGLGMAGWVRRRWA